MPIRRSLLAALPALGTAALLPGCGTSPDTFARQGPPFRPEEFFAAHLRSNGLIVTRLGAVNGWFTCDLVGAWDGTTLSLDEYFVFDDTREERRFWQLRKDPTVPGGEGWTGDATDAAGAVAGSTSGNALNLQYAINHLMLDGSRRRLGYDQWFVRLNDDTALSRASISWYGIGVATAQVSFRRLGPRAGSVYAGAAYDEARRASRPATQESPAAQPGRPEPGRSIIGPRR